MNRFPRNLGFHFGGNDPKTWMQDAINAMAHTKVLQFMISPPQSFMRPSRNKIQKICSLMTGGLKPVIHCPYLVTTTRDNPKLMDFTINYLVDLYMMLGEFSDKVVPYVLHTGKPPKDDPEGKQAGATMKAFLNKLSASLERNKINNDFICFETDASCYNPFTRLSGLVPCLSEYGDPRYRICLDTEHSFASGYDISKPIPNEVWNWIGVLHLNAIPPEVVFGKGLDRHSFTRIRECSQGAPMLHSFEEAIRRDLPIILERSDMGVIQDDLTYLSGRYEHLLDLK